MYAAVLVSCISTLKWEIMLTYFLDILNNILIFSKKLFHPAVFFMSSKLNSLVGRQFPYELCTVTKYIFKKKTCLAVKANFCAIAKP